MAGLSASAAWNMAYNSAVARKSVHSHIFLDRAAPIDEVVRLRRLLVLCLLGDPAVTRPHQPMRFPGFYRREKGNYQELIKTSHSRYGGSRG